jgi:hypothetical protein
LAARISAFRGSSEASHIRRAIDDARWSCLLLLISAGKHDRSMIKRLETITFSNRPSKSLKNTGSLRSSKITTSIKESSPDTAKGKISEPIPLRFHSLLDTFSVPAFFLLVRNIISSVSAIDEAQTEEDIILLQKTYACYKELDARTQANNHTRKVGRAFEKLLEVVNLIKLSQHRAMPPNGTQQSSIAHISPTTQDFFGGLQGFSDFTNLPTPSAYPMPTIPCSELSTKNTSTRTADTARTSTSPGLLTPMESEYMGQTCDTIRPDPFS